MSFNVWLASDRLEKLAITKAEYDRAVGADPDIFNPRTDPEQVSIATLYRFAELLRVHPADLLSDIPLGRDAAHAEAMLLEFAMAAREREFGECAEVLGWSESRLQSVINEFYRTSPGSPRMGVARGLGMIHLYIDEPPPPPASAFRCAFAAHTAPDPFEAAALLRIMRAGLDAQHASPAYTSASEAQRLADRRLVEQGPPDPDGAPFADSGLDVPVTTHPDLLFALDLSGPPTGMAWAETSGGRSEPGGAR